MNAARALEEIAGIEERIAALKAELQGDVVELAAPKVFMKLGEYAAHRNVSRSTVRRWIAAGMPISRRLGVPRINVAEADAWDGEEAAKQAATLAASKGKR